MKAQYCMFCGARYSDKAFASLEQEHQLRCEDCSRTWYNNPKPVVLAYITNSEGKILLGQRGIEPLKGSWGMPGGFIEYGEEPRDAILREIREELSVEGEVVEILASFHEFYDNLGDPAQRSSTTGVAFRCRLPNAAITAADDVAALAWYTPSEADGLVKFENQRRFLSTMSQGEKFL